MGVPAFFRWLSKKYPSILLHCVEEKPKEVGDETIPVDTSQPNPNDYEFDNLYLDMNGIIHPCCHPEDKPAPKNENEMMVLIFEYIDRIFSIVRPRKVLYMAIDGVAPRAKMNQQRSRRFRASKEITEKIEEMARLRDELTQKGCDLPPEKEKGEHFDSNCITPGTPFMFRLADCLRYYIHDRVNTDPGWQNIKVILSDANVPGEGEHKIMDYIRRQRDQPDHDPNTKHCLNGADADLIMLGLATHEPHFTIIREEFKPNKPRSCDMCGQMGHEMKDCTGLPKEKVGEHDDGPVMFDSEQQFIFLRLNILREYLERELLMTNLPFKYDFERSLDDWVFMCFFVGNDFLPHLPSLEIRENAIDRLIKLYKNCVRRTGGYLTDSGVVNLSRVQIIMQELGEVEDEIFKKRRNNELEFQRRNKERKAREKRFSQGPRWTPGGQFAPQALGQSHSSSVSNPRQEAYKGRVDAMQSMMTKDEPGKGTKRSAPDSDDTDKTEKEKEKEEEEEKEPDDEVKLWEDGWKDRYYKSKFDVDKDDIEFRHNVARHYVTGLSWVLRYYYQGCASWKWYFPYHYAPFASDFVNISDLPNDFEKHTNPFKPLEQLMGVFPAGSKKHLPLTWQTLMFDPESPIIDFYPTDFRIDLNGKKYAWQGVALLPFVDEKRLLKGLETVYSDLTPEEVFRNGRGKDRLFVGKRHPAHSFFEGLYEGERSEEGVEVNPSLTHGMAGRVWCDDKATMSGETIKSPLPQPEMKDILDNQCLCILYKDPVYDDDHLFPSKVLPNAKFPRELHILETYGFRLTSRMPERVLKPEDFDQRNRGKSWMPQLGFQKHSGYRGDRKDSSAANRMLRGSMGRGNNQGGGGWNRQSMYKSHSAPSLRYPRGGGYGGGYGGAQGYGGGGGGGGGGYNSGNNRGGGQRYGNQGNQGNQGWQGNMKNQGNAYNRNQQQGGYGGYQGGGGGGGYNQGGGNRGGNQGGGNWGGNQGGGNWSGNQQGGSNWGGNQRGGNRNQQQYRGGGGGGGNYNSNNRGQDRYRPY